MLRAYLELLRVHAPGRVLSNVNLSSLLGILKAALVSSRYAVSPARNDVVFTPQLTGPFFLVGFSLTTPYPTQLTHSLFLRAERSPW